MSTQRLLLIKQLNFAHSSLITKHLYRAHKVVLCSFMTCNLYCMMKKKGFDNEGVFLLRAKANTRCHSILKLMYGRTAIYKQRCVTNRMRFPKNHHPLLIVLNTISFQKCWSPVYISILLREAFEWHQSLWERKWCDSGTPLFPLRKSGQGRPYR